MKRNHVDKWPYFPRQFPEPRNHRPYKPKTFVCDLCREEKSDIGKNTCEECGVTACEDCWEREDYFDGQASGSWCNLNIHYHGKYCPTCYRKEWDAEIEEFNQKLDEEHRSQEARLEEERRHEQELIEGAEREEAKREHHDHIWQYAKEHDQLIQCESCKDQEPKEYFEKCDRCKNTFCYKCISAPGDFFYRSLETFTPQSFGKLCPNCFRVIKEEFEEEQRKRNREQAEQAENAEKEPEWES